MGFFTSVNQGVVLHYSDELCQEFKKKEMSSKNLQAEYPE